MRETASYPAKASSPQLGNDVVEGRIRCFTYELKFESDAFEIAFPWKDLVVTTTGNEEDQVFFYHPSAREVTLYTEDAEILEEPVFGKLTHLRRQVEKYRQRSGLKRYVKTTVYCLAGLLAGTLVLSWLSTKVMEWAAQSIPLETEMEWGNELLGELKKEGATIQTNQLSRQLTDYANRLFPSSPAAAERIRVMVLKDDAPNAFALPGRMVLFSTGLLEFLDSPEEVVGVLAHEVAHVHERHSMQKLVQSAGPAFALEVLFGKGGSIAGIVKGGSWLLIQQGFSREHEYEADRRAWDWLVRNRIDPRGLIAAFEKIQKMESRIYAVPTVFSSHPPTTERIRILEGRWQELSRKNGFEEVRLETAD